MTTDVQDGAQDTGIPSRQTEPDVTRLDVLVENLPLLRAKIEAANKRAKKLRLPPVELEVVGEARKVVRELPRYHPEQPIQRVKVWAVPVEVRGEPIIIKGWRFLAFLEALDDGANLVLTRDDDFDIRPWIDRNLDCDHCGCVRNRKYAVVIENVESGKQMLVGKTCLKDFLGGHDPHLFANQASYLKDVKEVREDDWLGGGGGGGGGAPSSIHVPTFLAYAVKEVEDHGYTKDDLGNTGDTVLEAYMDGRGKDRPSWWPAAERKAEEVRRWVIEESPKLPRQSNYLLNLQSLLAQEYAPFRTNRFLASAVPTYDREMEREAERRRRAAMPQAAGYLGEVGERWEGDVVLDKVFVHENPMSLYGPSFIHKFHTSEGHRLTWFGSAPLAYKHLSAEELDARREKYGGQPEYVQEGETVRIRGTVKAHKEYKGVPETTLARVMVAPTKTKGKKAKPTAAERKAAVKPHLAEPLDRMVAELTYEGGKPPLSWKPWRSKAQVYYKGKPLALVDKSPYGPFEIKRKNQRVPPTYEAAHDYGKFKAWFVHALDYLEGGAPRVPEAKAPPGGAPVHVHRASIGDQWDTEEGTVEVVHLGPGAEGMSVLRINGGRTYKVPTASVALHVQDLRHHPGPIDHADYRLKQLSRGDATFLGRGNDGMVFKVGPKVVKVATVTPYVPDNPGHRTREEAVRHGRHEYEVHRALQGVPLVLPLNQLKSIQAANRHFLIKPYMQVVEGKDLTQPELEALRDAVAAIHECGYQIRDLIQLARLGDDLYFMDLGSATLLPPPGAANRKYAIEGDWDHVQALFRAAGVPWTPTGEELVREEKRLRRLIALHARHGNRDKLEHDLVRWDRYWKALSGELADGDPNAWMAFHDEIEPFQAALDRLVKLWNFRDTKVADAQRKIEAGEATDEFEAEFAATVTTLRAKKEEILDAIEAGLPKRQDG